MLSMTSFLSIGLRRVAGMPWQYLAPTRWQRRGAVDAPTTAGGTARMTTELPQRWVERLVRQSEAEAPLGLILRRSRLENSQLSLSSTSAFAASEIPAHACVLMEAPLSSYSFSTVLAQFSPPAFFCSHCLALSASSPPLSPSSSLTSLSVSNATLAQVNPSLVVFPPFTPLRRNFSSFVGLQFFNS